jgi:hypothetical protein
MHVCYLDFFILCKIRVIPFCNTALDCRISHVLLSKDNGVQHRLPVQQPRVLAGKCVTNLGRARSLRHLRARLLAEKQKMGVSALYRIEWMISE